MTGPSIRVHQYLLDSAGGGLEVWLRALDRVAPLQRRAVVAGHRNKDPPDDPAVLDETRDYACSPTSPTYVSSMTRCASATRTG